MTLNQLLHQMWAWLHSELELVLLGLAWLLLRYLGVRARSVLKEAEKKLLTLKEDCDKTEKGEVNNLGKLHIKEEKGEKTAEEILKEVDEEFTTLKMDSHTK